MLSVCEIPLLSNSGEYAIVMVMWLVRSLERSAMCLTSERYHSLASGFVGFSTRKLLRICKDTWKYFQSTGLCEHCYVLWSWVDCPLLGVETTDSLSLMSWFSSGCTGEQSSVWFLRHPLFRSSQRKGQEQMERSKGLLLAWRAHCPWQLPTRLEIINSQVPAYYA